MNRSHPLERPFQRHLRALRRSLLPAIAGHVEALHRARVASRRLREVLPLIESELPRASVRKIRRRVRRVTRALGAVRELDVALGVLGERERSRQPHQATIARLRQHISGAREARREQMLERLAAVDTERLDRELVGLDRGLRKAGSGNAWREVLAGRIARRAARVRDAVAHAGALYLPERVHAVRVAVKKLRYNLELSTGTAAARATGATGKLKKMQNTLGRLHDLEVVLRHVQAVQADSDPRQPWTVGLGALVRTLEGECRRLHGRYVARRTALPKVCQTAVETAARVSPRRQRDVARRRPLKMSLEKATPAEQASAGKSGRARRSGASYTVAGYRLR